MPGYGDSARRSAAAARCGSAACCRATWATRNVSDGCGNAWSRCWIRRRTLGKCWENVGKMLGKCGKMWENVEKMLGTCWENVGKCRENVGKCGENVGKVLGKWPKFNGLKSKCYQKCGFKVIWNIMGLPKLVWDWLVEANIVKFGGYRYGIVGNGFVLRPQCEGVDVPLSCDYGGFPCYPATHPTNWCSRTCHLLFFYVCLKALIQKWTSHGQPSSIHTPMQTIEVPHPEMSLSGSLLPFSWSLSCNSNGRVHPIKSYEPLTFHRWVSTIRLISEATVSNPGSDMNLDHNVCVLNSTKSMCFQLFLCFFHEFSQFVYYHDSSSDWFARCGPHPSPWSQR